MEFGVTHVDKEKLFGMCCFGMSPDGPFSKALLTIIHEHFLFSIIGLCCGGFNA